MAEEKTVEEMGFFERLAHIKGTVASWLGDAADYFVKVVKNIAGAVVDATMTKAEQFMDWILVLSGQTKESLTDYQLKITHWIYDVVNTSIKYTLEEADAFKLTIRAMLTDIINYSMEKGNMLYTKVKEIFGSIQAEIEQKTTELAQTLSNITGTIKDLVKEGIAHLEEVLEFPEQFLASVAEISEERWIEVGDYFTKLLGRTLTFATKEIELKEPNHA